MDTPGIFKPRRRLDRAMVTIRLGRRQGCRLDHAADRQRARPARRCRGDPRGAEGGHQPKMLVLNKIDRVKREELLALVGRCQREDRLRATFMISAENGSGCDDVMDYLAEDPAGRPLVLSGGPDFRSADAPARGRNHPREAFLCACTRNFPTPRMSRPRSGKSARTARSASSRSSMSSATARRRSRSARTARRSRRSRRPRARSCREILEQPVHLFLFVKVRENWGDDPERFREMGLDFPR